MQTSREIFEESENGYQSYESSPLGDGARDCGDLLSDPQSTSRLSKKVVDLTLSGAQGERVVWCAKKIYGTL